MFSKISNPACKKTVRRNLYLIILSTIISVPVKAIDPGSKAPIEIESDQAMLDDKSGTSTYSGNVIVSQGLTSLQADYITVTSQDRKIISITAIGNPAHFSQQTNKVSAATHGYGKQITYTTQDETLLFKGDAKLIQADNSFSGETIEYDVIKKAIKAKGNESQGSRVKIQYFPEGKSSTEDQKNDNQTLNNEIPSSPNIDQ